MADLIFYNGIIHTMAEDAAETKVSAAAVSGNLIEAVGGAEENAWFPAFRTATVTCF